MKKYSVGLILVALILAVALFLLVAEFKPIDSLMKPPKVEGENLAIQLAFEESVGDEYLLKRPLRGDYRSAYTFIDIDGDDDDEVIVFYSSGQAIDIVRMNVLDKSGGVWHSIADFESLHNQIQEIKFADLNGDKLKEILVGWTTYKDNFSKLLSVYKITQSANGVLIAPIFDDSYSYFETMDIDSDGNTDILSIKYLAVPNAPEAEYRASFLSYTNDEITEKGSIPLDRSISSVTSVVSDYDSNAEHRRIYIDGYKIDSGMATDCLYWNNEDGVFNKYIFNNVSLSAISSRVTGVSSGDINGDGIVEIPTEEFLPASSVISPERATESEQCIIKWVQINDAYLTTVEHRLINSQAGYSVRIDSNWLGKLTVVNDLSKDVLTFCQLKNTGGRLERGAAYFSIKTVTDENSVSYFSTDYDYLFNRNGQYYYCRIYDNADNLNITYKKIKNIMILG